jgi:hypothetical protein
MMIYNSIFFTVIQVCNHKNYSSYLKKHAPPKNKYTQLYLPTFHLISLKLIY